MRASIMRCIAILKKTASNASGRNGILEIKDKVRDLKTVEKVNFQKRKYFFKKWSAITTALVHPVFDSASESIDNVSIVGGRWLKKFFFSETLQTYVRLIK